MCSIRKTFLDVTASSDVNFTLREGEICALLGENGAGKTSHEHPLRILCRRTAARSAYGEKVSLFVSGDAIARGMSMVHQHFTLVPSQTVLENVVVGSSGGRFLDLSAARKSFSPSRNDSGSPVRPDAPSGRSP